MMRLTLTVKDSRSFQQSHWRLGRSMTLFSALHLCSFQFSWALYCFVCFNKLFTPLLSSPLLNTHNHSICNAWWWRMLLDQEYCTSGMQNRTIKNKLFNTQTIHGPVCTCEPQFFSSMTKQLCTQPHNFCPFPFPIPRELLSNELSLYQWWVTCCRQKNMSTEQNGERETTRQEYVWGWHVEERLMFEDAPSSFKSAIWEHFGFSLNYNGEGAKVVNKKETVCKHCLTLVIM